MRFLPTYLTAFIFLAIFTAQVYKDVDKKRRQNNLLYFIAITLFMALLNLLFSDRVAGIALVAGISAWLLGVIILSFFGDESPVLPKCSSSAPPPAPEPCPCNCNDGPPPCATDKMECVDLHL
jgi:hypothetical protein